MSDRSIIIIPARMASTRLPNKPLLPIAGKPMIAHVIERAFEADIGPVIVACAEETIAEAARAAGAQAILTDPAHPSGTDRIYQALKALPDGHNVDLVINLQGDLPTIDARDIRLVRDLLLKHPHSQITTLAVPIDEHQAEDRKNPNIVKAVLSVQQGENEGRALYFTRATAPWGEGVLYHHIGIYGYRRQGLERFVSLPPSPLEKRERLEQLRALEDGMQIHVGIVDAVPLGVDTAEDLAKADILLKNRLGESCSNRNKDIDVVGIGHAIVDILAHVEEPFISNHSLQKGVMSLIDEAQATSLYAALPPAIEMSGGSAANTIAGIAYCGGKGAFLGKVRDDQWGSVFRHDLNTQGILFTNHSVTQGPSTARSYVLVTPDAERTMQTYLGMASHLVPDDIDQAVINRSKILYIEGYLWDLDTTQRAIETAIAYAKQAETKVALSLSDPFCVHRHRETFMRLIQQKIDILFGNEEEICALVQQESFDKALPLAANLSPLVVITRGAKGAVVVARGSEPLEVPAQTVDHVVDTTGAGDLFAAGFLWNLTQDQSLKECAVLGNTLAAKVIQQLGARLQG